MTKRPDYLTIDHLAGTFTDYDQNTLVQFLLKLFPDDADSVFEAVRNYQVGTTGGFTVFPTISKTGKVCKAKLIKFNQSGHTLKYPNGNRVISSLESKLKEAGRLSKGFETDKDVFFGEHLCSKYPVLPIAIVESEKSAVIASICKGAFVSNFVWLGSHSKQWLKPDRIRRLGRDRTIVLYPDADGFEKWQLVASNARAVGLKVKVSTLIEMRATDAEKADQVDLADYLIDVQNEITRKNGQTPTDLATILQERISIMMFDGGLSEADAIRIARQEVGISWN